MASRPTTSPFSFTKSLSILALLTVVMSGCGAVATSDPDPATSTTTPVAGLFEIADGRSLYLTCQGSGSPTVLFVSGTRGAADEWNTLLPDAVAGTLSTFNAVSQVTRVCAYDRPGTLDDSGGPTKSSKVAQPVTALQSAADLNELVDAAGESGPFVVVGLSWGGMIAQQFVGSHPDDVEGVVLLDSASPALQNTFTPEQWSAWMAAVRSSIGAAGLEAPDYEASIRDLGATPLPVGLPATVLSSDHPWDLQVVPGASTWPAWVAAQADLARSLDAAHITDTDSGHGIPVEQPALVTDAIVQMVESLRS